MKVTNVSARYGRSRQPAKYESAEAVIEFTATLDATIGNDDDHVATAVELLGQAKTIVLTELGLVPAGQSASAHTVVQPPAPAAQPAAATEKGGKGGKKKNEPAPPAQQAGTALGREVPAAKPQPGDIPTDDSAPQQQAQQQPAAPQPGDIPTESSGAAAPQPATQAQTAAAAGELTPAAVQKYITSCLVAKKFLPNVVLGLLKNDYKVDRVFDLKEPQLTEFYNKIKTLAGEG